MAQLAIIAENLGKRYNLRKYAENKSLSIKDSLAGLFFRSRNRRPSTCGQDGGIVRALDNVSFGIKQGEVVGIIGRNGAGKTTLFKIISKITKPTSGSVKVSGRVGSLLEVGTGFHPDLTGRENIYFNGIILGMKRREIGRRFEEIVEFSGIGEFLDTPIKYYSNGMYVRLAFAVAAHLDTDILLIDEILSVGDMRFQKKCFEKIGEEIKKERTVLFISHNMSVINALCSRAILLDHGKILAEGNKETVINEYINRIYQLMETDLSSRSDRSGSGVMRFIKYHLENAQGQNVKAFRSGEEAVIAVEYVSDSREKLRNVSVSFVLNDFLGNNITDLANRVSGEIWPLAPSRGIVRCRIKRLPLVPGTYTFNVFCRIEGVISDMLHDAGKFDVEVGSFFANSRLPDSGVGVMLMDHEWTVTEVNS
ncbi:MAG: ABC transporter ATP-binding protein [Candidatus Omnitrophica bacterium]|nr:ABC transporter ATP-binding protein [Candidatus Omnitrophota bacterium]